VFESSCESGALTEVTDPWISVSTKGVVRASDPTVISSPDGTVWNARSTVLGSMSTLVVAVSVAGSSGAPYVKSASRIDVFWSAIQVAERTTDETLTSSMAPRK
jgi:hypothetical protein